HGRGVGRGPWLGRLNAAAEQGWRLRRPALLRLACDFGDKLPRALDSFSGLLNDPNGVVHRSPRGRYKLPGMLQNGVGLLHTGLNLETANIVPTKVGYTTSREWSCDSCTGPRIFSTGMVARSTARASRCWLR